MIMDLTVPSGMGGVEAWRRIRALHPEARGIVSSGYSTDPVMSEPSAYGFPGVIAEPFTLAEIAAEVARVLTG